MPIRKDSNGQNELVEQYLILQWLCIIMIKVYTITDVQIGFAHVPICNKCVFETQIKLTPQNVLTQGLFEVMP